MPHLIELYTWRLIQAMRCQLGHRKAEYKTQSSLPRGYKDTHLEAELFEVELRRVFTINECPRDLDPIDFEQCQAQLDNLCSLLEDLGRFRNAYSNREDQVYPKLQSMITFLGSTSNVLDLANGPNETLFDLPNDRVKLREYLQVLTECNDVLSKLTAIPLQEPTVQAVRKQRKTPKWKRTATRNHATSVLETLLKHFTCGPSHEVLLKLTEDPDEGSNLPSLHLVLSSCAGSEQWQEARCESLNLDETQIPRIDDICLHLQQHAGRGKTLMLLVEKYGMFGAWSNPKFPGMCASSKESLGQFITNGAFRPLGVESLYGLSGKKVSTRDKRALALKLGFCLMDFFDANLASTRIYFLDSSPANIWKELPYLAFSSNLAAPADPYNFKLGHSALLSFAKVLLEIHTGECIDLDISPDNSKNLLTWAKFCQLIDTLESEGGDSYLEAIRGCLTVHTKIMNALDSRDIEGVDADLKIREFLYADIVSKLELALAGSNPRSINKRQRSESPPISDHWDDSLAPKPTTMAIRASSRELKPPAYKRQRAGKMVNEASASLISQQPTLRERDEDRTEVITTTIQPSLRQDFQIAIICALPLEYNAVSHIFDEFWDEDDDKYGKAEGDLNIYTTGRIGKYNVVLALLPQMGKANAASTATSIRFSYVGVRLALLVGICGGVPFVGVNEVLLGDVVISETMYQYDFGRKYPDKFVPRDTNKDNLGRPNKEIRSLLITFETDRGRDRLEDRISHFLQQLQNKVDRTKRRGKYKYPGSAADKLFEASYRHKHHVQPSCVCRECLVDADPVCQIVTSSSCKDLGCDDERLVPRQRLQAQGNLRNDIEAAILQPIVHLGGVASGDTVMKSATDRDKLSKEGVIAFDMEGAGVWDEVPCILIKGVCDYADSHKHKGWQDYAAATAAAASQAILERFPQIN